jgi:FixJ family two-component response regulator
MTPPQTIYIAVVDDDESYARSLVRLLRAADYQAITYSSAEAFLADHKHPRFDCLVLDIALGAGISGLELARRLALVGAHTPIVYVSAHDDEKTRNEADGTGCRAFVSKVESSATLLKAIEEALAI